MCVREGERSKAAGRETARVRAGDYHGGRSAFWQEGLDLHTRRYLPARARRRRQCLRSRALRWIAERRAAARAERPRRDHYQIPATTKKRRIKVSRDRRTRANWRDSRLDRREVRRAPCREPRERERVIREIFACIFAASRVYILENYDDDDDDESTGGGGGEARAAPRRATRRDTIDPSKAVQQQQRRRAERQTRETPARWRWKKCVRDVTEFLGAAGSEHLSSCLVHA